MKFLFFSFVFLGKRNYNEAMFCFLSTVSFFFFLFLFFLSIGHVLTSLCFFLNIGPYSGLVLSLTSLFFCFL